MWKKILISVLCLFFLGGCGSTSSSKSSDAGKELRKNFLANKVPSTLSDNKKAWDIMYDIYWSGTPEVAVKRVTRNIVDHPETAWSYLVRGQAYFTLKEYDLAVVDLDEAARLLPKNGDVYLYRGISRARTCTSTTGCVKSIEDLHRAIDLGSDIATELDGKKRMSTHARLVRGRGYAKLKQPEKALDDYNWVIDKEPEYVAAIGSRGYTYLEIGAFDKAFQDGMNVQALASEGFQGYLLMALSRSFAGRYEEAIRYNRKCLNRMEVVGATEHLGGTIYNNLGVAQWGSGNLYGAEESFKSAINYEREGSNPLPYIRYGSVLHDLGRKSEAEEIFRRARAIDRNALNSLLALKPKYSHTASDKEFFAHQETIARRYLQINGESLHVPPPQTEVPRPSGGVSTEEIDFLGIES